MLLNFKTLLPILILCGGCAASKHMESMDKSTRKMSNDMTAEMKELNENFRQLALSLHVLSSETSALMQDGRAVMAGFKSKMRDSNAPSREQPGTEVPQNANAQEDQNQDTDSDDDFEEFFNAHPEYVPVNEEKPTTIIEEKTTLEEIQ